MRHNHHRHRVRRYLLTEMRRSLRCGQHVSRKEAVALALARARAPEPLTNQALWDASVRGIGMSTLTSQMAWGKHMHRMYLAALASYLGA